MLKCFLLALEVYWAFVLRFPRLRQALFVIGKIRPTIRKKNTNNLNLYYLITNDSCEFCTII